ncbi:MAG TPA: GNAT family N-acetyltransferase [Propioniciclava sp.]|jgi:ribosomal protein S18 acetylase RimI-like enzyme|uniref:GNAT family N-acetyltransferase n=1 Tax=Propioniciclava sp. TaxID=2038686 RepID=UPI002BB99166|nr:GNAT family N-acetyltransferase [Propioniciclava sp.]HRL50368.1 GNAT family N-acetyltransferase [Propioniciclava sp.]HRL80735.1 GNAT family N-acetyltransferase [Propioniciclava sp.]
MSENPTAAVAAARLATRDDLPSLEANETDKTRGLSATYLDEQERGDFYVVVGLLDGEVVGRVVLDVRDDPSVLAPEMKLLWVVPSARRKGLGAVMTHELEALARSLGYDEIFLGVSADNNPAAIPLYVSLDYTPTGDHRSAINLSVIDADAPIGDDPTEAIFRKSLRVR